MVASIEHSRHTRPRARSRVHFAHFERTTDSFQKCLESVVLPTAPNGPCTNWHQVCLESVVPPLRIANEPFRATTVFA